MIINVELAEQEPRVSVVRRLVLVARAFQASTGVRVQTEHPRQREAEAQQPDGGHAGHH